MKPNAIIETVIISIAATALAYFTPTANAATLSFDGHIILVAADEAEARYHQTSIDDTFSGSFTYGDTAGTPDTMEADEADYEFIGASFGGTITDGNASTTGSSVSVNIQNNHPLDPDEVVIANLILSALGQNTTVVQNQEIDVWAVSGIEDGASFDNSDNLTNGHAFEVFFISLNGSLVDDLSFQPLPPLPTQVDLIGFSIEEGDSNGSPLFTAFGLIDRVVIPEPASAWLLLAGVTGLLTITRRARA